MKSKEGGFFFTSTLSLPFIDPFLHYGCLPLDLTLMALPLSRFSLSTVMEVDRGHVDRST
ncbi:hypothetical protein Scep_001961 [Stephania cephalantha]|uniref:Uncharacterized protein n=1 Tax=Stephania cephalantha TaxID=152367 RepID=A0AAP0LBT2_9MAGN